MKEGRNSQDLAEIRMKALKERLERFYQLTDGGVRFTESFLRTLKGVRDAEARKELCNYEPKYLMAACKNQHLELIEFMGRWCSVDMDQHEPNRNTALLWSADAGHLGVVILLAFHGANINWSNANGHTALDYASGKGNEAMVQQLIELGADVNHQCREGLTSLMQGVPHIEACELLIRAGTELDTQDNDGCTALHHAVLAEELTSVVHLLDRGADPRIRNRCNEDILIIACKECLAGVIECLEYRYPHWYGPEQLASAYELFGAMDWWTGRKSFYATWKLWYKATSVRKDNSLAKTVLIYSGAQHPVHGPGQEFRGDSELYMINSEREVTKQSLLICERVLGTGHTLYADVLERYILDNVPDTQLKHRLEICLYMLQYEIQQDCLFSESAHRWVNNLLFLVPRAGTSGIESKDYTEVCVLLISSLIECAKLLTVQPRSREHQERFDVLLEILIQRIPANPEMRLKSMLYQFMRSEQARTSSGDTLLHLSLATPTGNRYTQWTSVGTPCFNVVKLLLECGADVNAMNYARNTPLHYAARPDYYMPAIVGLLLHHGAHLDARNCLNRTPLAALTALRVLDEMHNTSLACLAARAIVRNGVPFEGEVPKSLHEFIKLH